VCSPALDRGQPVGEVPPGCRSLQITGGPLPLPPTKNGLAHGFRLARSGQGGVDKVVVRALVLEVRSLHRGCGGGPGSDRSGAGQLRLGRPRGRRVVAGWAQDDALGWWVRAGRRCRLTSREAGPIRRGWFGDRRLGTSIPWGAVTGAAAQPEPASFGRDPFGHLGFPSSPSGAGGHGR
jgi:hypothetical protein